MNDAPRRLARLLAIASVLAIAGLFSACDRATPAPTAADFGPDPKRIISVGGAVTETVFALGAGERVIAVDTSSLHPEAAIRLPKVGYQRQLAAEGILGLRPTLVIAAAEAGPPAVLEQLRSAGLRVEVLSADASVEGARARITAIGRMVGRDPSKVLADLDRDLARAGSAVARTNGRPRVLAVYARGGGTLHVFGRGTSADALVRLAGGENAASALDGAKPLTAEAAVQCAPEVILIPSRGLESLGGAEGLWKQPGIAQTPAGKSRRMVAMDDLLMLGFGPRTGEATLALAEQLHPELADAASPGANR
jgi:iron complex transport system substrate-binding protein